MIIRQIGREDKFQVLANAFNASGEKMSVGVMVCWDWKKAASHGNAVIAPYASGIGLFAGAVAHGYPEAYTDWAANSFGLIMVEGVHESFAYSVGAASLSCAGQWQIPVATLYSGQTNNISGVGLSWTSQTLLISRGAFLLSNDLSGNGWGNAYIRAL